MMYRKLVMMVACLLALAISSGTLAQKPDSATPPDTTAQANDDTQAVKESKRPKKQKPDKPLFMRLKRDKQGEPVALEVAIVRYGPSDRSRKSPVVDLVGAVHVGEKSYYERLNREFRKYDSVLYELVAPEGTTIPKGGVSGRRSMVSGLQGGIKNILELSFQLEHVDYTRKNMVHADMSPEQFAKSMKDRGESFLGMFLRAFGYAMAQQNKSGGASDFQLLMALFDKDRAMALKRIMAEQFENMEGSMNVLEGPNGSTIVGERNKVALKVLRKQIDAGEKKLAVFYGAGHMADFQKRLREDFGLVPRKTRWLVAWDLQGKDE